MTTLRLRVRFVRSNLIKERLPFLSALNPPREIRPREVISSPTNETSVEPQRKSPDEVVLSIKRMHHSCDRIPLGRNIRIPLVCRYHTLG